MSETYIFFYTFRPVAETYIIYMLLLYTIRPIKIFISSFGQKLLFMLFGQIDKLYVSAKIRFSIYFFFQIIRTNNDAEGWHNKLNSKGKGAGLHFYELVDLLFAESEFVQVEEAYLKQNQTTRHTQLGQKVLQHQLFVLWEDYDRDKTDTYRLLQKLTRQNMLN